MVRATDANHKLGTGNFPVNNDQVQLTYQSLWLCSRLSLEQNYSIDVIPCICFTQLHSWQSELPAYWAWRCLSADFLLNYGFMHCCLLTKPSKLPSPIVALTISLISHYYFHVDILIALLLAFYFFQVFRPGFSDTIIISVHLIAT